MLQRDMYGKSSPTSPKSKGIPYGQTIEWKTPRLQSINTPPRRGSDGLVSRNLMQDQLFSDPSSPKFSAGEPSHHTKSYSKLKAERKASKLSKERYQENSNSATSLSIQPQHVIEDSPLRKWSSYSGLSNDIIDGLKSDRSATSNSYHASIENLQAYSGPSVGGYVTSQMNPRLDQGTGSGSSIAYVAPLRQDLTSNDGYTTPKSSRSRTPSSTTSTDDADKWDSLLKAKDDLITQKDQIIDRQKKTIAQLQHQHLNMDAKLQHALLIKSCDQDSVVTLKLQEYQFETAQLRAQLSQVTNEKNTEIERLQRKLGETEYLLDQMDACVKDTAASKDKDVDSLHSQISSKDSTIADVQSKLDAAKKENLNMKHRIDGLERYLSEVPTTEEHQNTLKTISLIELSVLFVVHRNSKYLAAKTHS